MSNSAVLESDNTQLFTYKMRERYKHDLALKELDVCQAPLSNRALSARVWTHVCLNFSDNADLNILHSNSITLRNPLSVDIKPED